MIALLLKRRIFLGYASGTLSASLMMQITINTLSGGGGGDLAPNFVLFLILQVFVTLYTLVPSVLFIGYCEKRSIRSPAYYVAFSALLAFAGLPVILLNIDWEIFKTALIFTPSGIVSGLFYWYFAGRDAGDEARLHRAQIEAFD